MGAWSKTAQVAMDRYQSLHMLQVLQNVHYTICIDQASKELSFEEEIAWSWTEKID